MFRFAHTEFFWLFWVVALAMILYFLALYLKRSAISRFGNPELVKQLMPDVSFIKPFIKFTFLLLGLVMIILAAARPQMGTRLEEIKREGVEIIIALDVSNSMLAQDIRPNRLERAKQSIQRMTDRLVNDKIGLIVFGGKSFVQVPLTTDYTITKAMTAVVSPDMVPVQGTAIGSAIALAKSSFSQTEGTSRVLIIISDGENHEDDPVEAAKLASDEGIVIHTVGIGDPRGTPIPLPGGSARTDFLTDTEGKVVMTKLDETTLKQIASVSGGVYVRASGSDLGLNNILNEISGMEKAEFESRVYTDYEDYFQYFVALALFFLVMGIFISERKSKIFEKLNLFNR
jgi:Ca-activated chloride channel homolog